MNNSAGVPNEIGGLKVLHYGLKVLRYGLKLPAHVHKGPALWFETPALGSFWRWEISEMRGAKEKVLESKKENLRKLESYYVSTLASLGYHGCAKKRRIHEMCLSASSSPIDGCDLVKRIREMRMEMSLNRTPSLILAALTFIWSRVRDPGLMYLRDPRMEVPSPRNPVPYFSQWVSPADTLKSLSNSPAKGLGLPRGPSTRRSFALGGQKRGFSMLNRPCREGSWPG